MPTFRISLMYQVDTTPGFVPRFLTRGSVEGKDETEALANAIQAYPYPRYLIAVSPWKENLSWNKPTHH